FVQHTKLARMGRPDKASGPRIDHILAPVSNQGAVDPGLLNSTTSHDQSIGAPGQVPHPLDWLDPDRRRIERHEVRGATGSDDAAVLESEEGRLMAGHPPDRMLETDFSK